MRKKPRRAYFRPLFSVLAVIVGLVLVGPVSSASASQDKVGVCHRTASESNPYVLINVPQDEANGHITGDAPQHKGKGGTKYWATDGTWDGFTHSAGDPRLDYYAADGISKNCTNGEQPPPELNDASFTATVTDATCETGQTLTYSGDHVTFEGPASPVVGPATEVEVIATPEAGHGWSTEGASGTRTVFEGDLAGPDESLCPEVLPEDAAAGVSTSPASCEGAGALVLGDVTNATWGDPTVTDNSYSVVAMAAAGHLFPAGEGVSEDQTTKSFSGALEPAFTLQQRADNACDDVEGEQGHEHHGTKNTPEVKGEQAHTAPAAAVVPSEVEAGLAGAPAGTPTGGSSLPLWVLSLGAGLFLTGASRLRRTGRIPR